MKWQREWRNLLVRCVVRSRSSAGLWRQRRLAERNNRFDSHTKRMDWIHASHEEAAAFAAGTEARLTGKLAVCGAGSDQAKRAHSEPEHFW